MKNNIKYHDLHWVYLLGLFSILILPILTIQPWLFPPDWTKAIIFRSILVALLGFFLFQLLNGSITLPVKQLKKNTIFWFLIALLGVFLLATIFSVDTRFSLFGSPTRGGGFLSFASYIIFAILTFITVKKQWQTAWLFAIGSGVLVSLVAIFQFHGLLSTIFLAFPSSPPSTLGNSTFLAIYLLLLSSRVIFFFIKEPVTNIGFNAPTLKKTAYAVILLLFLWTILITGSRAGYLGIIIGGIYFVLLYPKKLTVLKIASAIALLLVISMVWFANTTQTPPKIATQNKTIGAIYSRLSIQAFLNDSRFYSWQIAMNAFKEKPIIGWGPENFSVGFDKHYDPSLPHVSNIVSNWWDRAHNILFDIGVQAGILGLITYLGLLISFFWGMQKIRERDKTNHEIALDAHLLQTGLIAYVTANLFSFDSFGTYLIFFMMLGYGMHLMQPETSSEQNMIPPAFLKWKTALVVGVILISSAFIWQYNLWPFIINAKANKVALLIQNSQCDRGFVLMEEVMQSHSILDARVRMQYVEMMNNCARAYPEKNLTYAIRGAEIMKEAVKIQPSFARLWIFLGGFTTVKASLSTDLAEKKSLLTEANNYLEQANALAPDHQELIMEQAKVAMIAEDYSVMKEYAQKCTLIYPTAGSCYFLSGIASIYLSDFSEAEKNFIKASANNYDIESTDSLNQLVTTYAKIENYQKLSEVYLKLIERKPEIANYYASLAFTYFQMGEYKKAREQALIFLAKMPSAKDEVEEFLRLIPK